MNFKLGLIGAVALWLQAANAQPTAFTYQGQLANGGTAANGIYDLRFRLFDAATNLVAGPVTNAPVGVTNGLFTTAVDLGAAGFNGSPRWLEIAVRPFGSPNAYTILSPSQPVNSTPYAIQSLNAQQLSIPLPATNISGTIPVSQLSTNVTLLTSNQTFTGANVFNGVVTAINPGNTFAGNGAGLSGLAATNLTGTLPDRVLSTNVPLVYNNANFLTNVTAVQFTGSGHGLTNVPGAFFWLTVSGNVAKASSNLGFIVTNPTTPVIITLPATPSVGDTFKVAGVGAGGWILAQNAGQQILAGNLANNVGLSWLQVAGTGANPWSAVAASADGTKLVATSANSSTTGYIWISTNSGANWFQTGTKQYWSSVASSADGTKLIATVGTVGGQKGLVYISVNSGNNWNAFLNSQSWTACASSADGSHLVAATSGNSTGGGIYSSTNGGANWTFASGPTYWTGLACSADGTKLVAVSNPGGGGYIYTSTNSGINWVQQNGAGVRNWSAVASSANGNHLVATVNSGSIYVSANSGVTWTSQNLNTVAWTSVTSSGDGSRLAATYSGPGYIVTSDDYGSTWLQRDGATNATWTAIAGSADGSKLVAAASDGNLWISGQSSTTTGTNGYLMGGYQSALELQYVGNGLFLPLNHEGAIQVY